MGIMEYPQQLHTYRKDTREWLAEQGYDQNNPLPRKVRWHRPDGTSSLGPSDQHHVDLYRARGFLLMPEDSLLHRTIRVSEKGRGDWTGTPTEFFRAANCRFPESPASVSKALTSRVLLEGLAAKGVFITRGWKGSQRILTVAQR